MVTKTTVRISFNELLDIVGESLDMDLKELEIHALHTEPVTLKRTAATHEFVFSEEERTGPHKDGGH